MPYERNSHSTIHLEVSTTGDGVAVPSVGFRDNASDGFLFNIMKNQQEKLLIRRFLETLSVAFKRVETEVKDSSGTSRIDMIVYPTEDVAFGIEFKQPNQDGVHRKHGSDLGRWLKQAERYSTTFFPHAYHSTHEQIPVFIYPPVTYNHLVFNPDVHRVNPGEELHEHNNVNSFIFQSFHVGELRKLSNRRFIFSSNCLNVADIRLTKSGWKCFMHNNKYNILRRYLKLPALCQQ